MDFPYHLGSFLGEYLLLLRMVLLFVNTVLFCCGLGLYRFQESKEDCRLGRSLVDCGEPR